jgi:hypothetical protein
VILLASGRVYESMSERIESVGASSITAGVSSLDPAGFRRALALPARPSRSPLATAKASISSLVSKAGFYAAGRLTSIGYVPFWGRSPLSVPSSRKNKTPLKTP